MLCHCFIRKAGIWEKELDYYVRRGAALLKKREMESSLSYDMAGRGTDGQDYIMK